MEAERSIYSRRETLSILILFILDSIFTKLLSLFLNSFSNILNFSYFSHLPCPPSVFLSSPCLDLPSTFMSDVCYNFPSIKMFSQLSSTGPFLSSLSLLVLWVKHTTLETHSYFLILREPCDVWILGHGLSHLLDFLVPFIFLKTSWFHFSLLINAFLLCTTFASSIHSLMDIYSIAIAWIL